MNYIQVNEQAYDRLATEYEKRATLSVGLAESSVVLGSAVLNHLHFGPSIPKVLEVGPGSGEMLAYFESRGCETSAVELSPSMAAIARKRSPRTEFTIGNILDTIFIEKQFDVIYAAALLHLFPLSDASVLLGRFREWLVDGGLVFINTTVHPVSEEGFFIKQDYPNGVKRFRRKWHEEELLSLLQQENLRPVERLVKNEADRQKLWVAWICRKG